MYRLNKANENLIYSSYDKLISRNVFKNYMLMNIIIQWYWMYINYLKHYILTIALYLIPVCWNKLVKTIILQNCCL
jgi:hypothetical protein